MALEETIKVLERLRDTCLSAYMWDEVEALGEAIRRMKDDKAADGRIGEPGGEQE